MGNWMRCSEKYGYEVEKMSRLFLYSVFGIILTRKLLPPEQQNRDLTHIHIHPYPQFWAQKSKDKTHIKRFPPGVRSWAVTGLQVSSLEGLWWCGRNWFPSCSSFFSQLLLQELFQAGPAGRSLGSGLGGAAPPGEPPPPARAPLPAGIHGSIPEIHFCDLHRAFRITFFLKITLRKPPSSRLSAPLKKKRNPAPNFLLAKKTFVNVN